MEKTVAEIVKDVRRIIDENVTSDSLSQFEDDETLALDDLISGKIEEGATIVANSAPLHMLEGKSIGSSEIVWNKNLPWGMVQLPKDYLRLLVFEMSDWSIPIFDTISVDDEKYKMQKSRFPGVRGNPDRPVCAEVQHEATDKEKSNLWLEFYSCSDKTATIATARYVAIPTINNGTIIIEDRVYKATTYCIAYLVMQIRGDMQTAESTAKVVEQLLQ